MIRSCIKNAIFDTLNYNIFRFEDFSISEKSSQYGEDTIQIFMDEYYYLMEFDENKCTISYSPGNVFMEESYSIEIGKFEYEITKSIQDWLRRVKKELLNPLQERFINQTIQDFKAKLDEKLNEIDDNFFTREECEELRNRLDVLEEMISDEKNQNAELKSEVEKMKDEIEFLKNTVGKSTKKKWLKSAMIKMWTWSQKPENKKLIEAGVDTVKIISKIDFPNIVE